MNSSRNIVSKLETLEQAVDSALAEYKTWKEEQEKLEKRKRELKSRAVKLCCLDVQPRLMEWIRSSGNYEPIAGWDMVPLDNYIWCFDFDTFYDIVREFWLPDKLPYITDKFDCDDFAIHFRAFLVVEFESNMAAYTQSQLHAFNTIILSDMRFMVFEPQNGIKFWRAGDAWYPQYYVPLRLIMW